MTKFILEMVQCYESKLLLYRYQVGDYNLHDMNFITDKYFYIFSLFCLEDYARRLRKTVVECFSARVILLFIGSFFLFNSLFSINIRASKLAVIQLVADNFLSAYYFLLNFYSKIEIGTIEHTLSQAKGRKIRSTRHSIFRNICDFRHECTMSCSCFLFLCLSVFVFPEISNNIYSKRYATVPTLSVIRL